MRRSADAVAWANWSFKLLGGLKNNQAKSLEFADFGDLAFMQPELVGALFIDSVGLKGVPRASECLAVVPVTRNEISVADLAGPSRLMGGLANQARYYPCPVWIDRKRKSAFSDTELRAMKEDLLLKMPSFWSPASMLVTQDRCSLSVDLHLQYLSPIAQFRLNSRLLPGL